MSDSSPDASLPSLPFRVAALSARHPTRVDFRPSEPERAAIAAALGLLLLPALRLTGELRPEGKRDFRLVARLQADAVQACSVTLAPVPATLAEDVVRLYQSDYAAPEEVEAEMPDDEVEPLPEVIDAAAVAMEALALSLPAFPRAPGSELGEAVFGPPGEEPLREADLKPFAGLAGLAQMLKGGGEKGE